MDNLYAGLCLTGGLCAGAAQLLLKRSALRAHSALWREYLNPTAAAGYALMLLSSLLTVVSYRGLPLQLGPVLSASSFLFVGAFGRLALKERMGKKQLCGYGLILLGICLAAL